VVDPGLPARWIGVNAAAYVAGVVGGVTLEWLASSTTRAGSEHRVVAVVLVAVMGRGSMARDGR
jgi:hypothetical protein